VAWAPRRVVDPEGRPAPGGAVLLLQVGQGRHRLVDDHVLTAGEWAEPLVVAQYGQRGPQLVRSRVRAQGARHHPGLLRGAHLAHQLDRSVADRVEHGGPEWGVLVGLASQEVGSGNDQPRRVGVAEQVGHLGPGDRGLQRALVGQGRILHRLDDHLQVLGHGLAPRQLPEPGARGATEASASGRGGS
jgi:hypothetical protein